MLPAPLSKPVPPWTAAHPRLGALREALGKRFPATLALPGKDLREKTAPLMLPSGIPEVDALSGGFPRGALTEICGAASSGRTALLLSLLAEAARRQEWCALVDASDTFCPHTAAQSGVDLRRLLWVRCHSGVAPRAGGHARAYAGVEQALKATDLLLHAGGFGVVAVDFGDLPATVVRRVPLASWYRFRRAVEHTRTALVAVEALPVAAGSAALVLRLENSGSRWPGAAGAPAHACLLGGLTVRVETARTPGTARPARRAAHSTSSAFAATALWAE